MSISKNKAEYTITAKCDSCINYIDFDFDTDPLQIEYTLLAGFGWEIEKDKYVCSDCSQKRRKIK